MLEHKSAVKVNFHGGRNLEGLKSGLFKHISSRLTEVSAIRLKMTAYKKSNSSFKKRVQQLFDKKAFSLGFFSNHFTLTHTRV